MASGLAVAEREGGLRRRRWNDAGAGAEEGPVLLLVGVETLKDAILAAFEEPEGGPGQTKGQGQ